MACELWIKTGELAREKRLIPFCCWPETCPFQSNPQNPDCPGIIMEDYYERRAELTDCGFFKPDQRPPSKPAQNPISPPPPPSYDVKIIYDPEINALGVDAASTNQITSIFATLSHLLDQNRN